MFSKAKQMIEADRAVSPVIGVALMIGVTVLLGAVVGGFVTGLGDSLTQDAPNTQIEFDYDSASESLTIAHGGGESISTDNAGAVRLSGSEASILTQDSSQDFYSDGSGTLATGDQITTGDTIASAGSGFSSGDSVEVVWVGPEGDTSATLDQFTA